jgi:peptidoglycan/LPS O-acetylase OafA/YrhL
MNPARSERLHFLDGLRGWAAVAVLLYHTFIEVFPYDTEVAKWLSFLLPFCGGAAVYAFFVISGFSLSIGYVRTHDGLDLARTAVSRYPRLALPILAATTLVYLLMLSGAIPEAAKRIAPLNLALQFEPSMAHVLQFSLFDVFFRFSFETAYILPLWSMEYELFGSALIIGLLAIVGRLKIRIWVYAALYVILAGASAFHATAGLYSLFVAGMILAELYHRWRPSRAIHYMLLAYLFCFGWLAPYLASHRPCFTYHAGIIAFCAASFWLPWVRSLLEVPLSRYLGRISFPLYLVHGPILYSFSLWMLKALQPLGFNPSTTNTIVALCTIPVAIGCAAAFEPLNSMAIRVSRRFGAAFVAQSARYLRRYERAPRAVEDAA